MTSLLPFYICMLTVIFQAISASTSTRAEHASLISESGGSKAKPVVGELARKRKAQDKRDKANVVSKEDRPKSLIELLLPKTPVEIVIGYMDTYPVLVSTHTWLFYDMPRIAVDGARLYVTTNSESLRGLSHASANLKEDERHCIAFGDPQWSHYYNLSSSHDGRHVFFSYSYKVPTDREVQYKHSVGWLTQDSKLEVFKPVVLDGEGLSCGLLSRDGQTLLSHNGRMKSISRAYQIMKEARENPTALMRVELNGMALAVSANGNRVMMAYARQLEIHDIDKDASKLVCRINVNIYSCNCALNEDGSEAAFVGFFGNELRVVDVDSVVGDNVDQSAIVTLRASTSLGGFHRPVYDDENKLHVLHGGGGVSFFDPSTKKLVLIEAPQEGREIVDWAISPNADYIATIQRVGYEERGYKHFYTTTVKRKLRSDEWRNLFGHKPVLDVKASAVLAEKVLAQTRNALPQSAPRTRLTTISVQEGSLCAFDGNLRYRYVLDDGWVIHRSAIDSGGDRGSVKLPTSLIKGAPQHLQANSDGTVFYVAAKRNKRRYIYVIDVASKRVYGYRLKHLESDIAEMKAHVGGKVLEMTMQDQLVLVFSCSNQRLYLRNKLIEGERVVGVSQSIAVFERDAGSTIGYFDLTKEHASLFSLPYRNARFVAVDKDDVYLASTKAVLRLNAKTKNITTINEHYEVRSSHVHDGSIRIIDHAFVYRVLDIKTLRQLYAIRLPLPLLQNDKPQILISPDGRRVMVRQTDVAHLFEIVDPEFISRTQMIKRPAETKPVEQAQRVDTQRSLMDTLEDIVLRLLGLLIFKLLSKMGAMRYYKDV